ncbi:hypothetical protein [Arthrobacter sp. HY1533]|uniref:hypothetical protein n=1 Tax=Arthrobacter sp. HY1533 TaxID=2970919 RepID=UPI0022BA03FC|nr:hypothetical protein [Arthrobacter sp. HY1533]
MSGTTASERGWEIGSGVGGFVGTGLLLKWIGQTNCPPPFMSPSSDFLGRLPEPPNPVMCALAGANDSVMSWIAGFVVGLLVFGFWEIKFALQRPA